MNTVIEFRNVWKSFKLGQNVDSLRDLIPHVLGRIRPGNDNPKKRREAFWALKDVSFEIEQGETVGLIGPNGSGKTTTLKLLSGILRQTKGYIMKKGQIGALIEIGAGFHGDLTGRENIYLNGSIMGMRKREIDEKFEEIVAFAEVEDFIDTPVKRFSSGMYVRLGFSVAAHLDPEILLVDEILSVGDASFQIKCAERIKQMLQNGLTLILVSHNLELVNHLCRRVILLSEGQILSIGRPLEITELYKKLSLSTLTEKKNSDATAVTITGILLYNGNGEVCSEFNYGDSLVIRFSYETLSRVENPVFSVVITTTDGTFCIELANSYDEVGPLHINKGKGYVELLMEDLRLTGGVYFISVAIGDRSTHAQYDIRQNICQVKVVGSSRGRGILTPIHEWKFFDGQ
jgi:lipopolysaccharide transport system ATP-binding protein